MTEQTFLLYGANGYTGELIARYSQQYQLQPILAGRNEAAIAALAAKLHLPYRIFELENTSALLQSLREVKAVVNAAGPFTRTAKKMVDACLQTGTHYLDINGDITVFELLKMADDDAKKAGIMVLPGVGFDVVPTDCLSLFLKNSLPDALSIQLAFATAGGGISHGTAISMLSKLGKGGAVRKNGMIVNVPLGHKQMHVDFGERKFLTMCIPWGDISTAYFTTGISDIETYTGTKPYISNLLKFQSMYNWLLRTSVIRQLIERKINRRPAGPSDIQRSKATAYIWGQVKNAAGKTITATMRCPEGYTLTAMAALLITQKVLQGNFKTGYQTPASAYGADLVLEVPGVKRAAG
ncbi:MAG: saccharopine dehydrogenase NADP-binding domain-containing protein [Chitinophagales bacterium]|nr:saccharopine dehydrogenase NADP-binding domain-containing protein [Chitinophagales bacterium]